MTVNRGELLDALRKVKCCISSNNSMSVLSMVQIIGDTLGATDLRETIIVPIPDLGFNAVVNYKEFLGVVSKARHDEIGIELHEEDDSVIQVETPDFKATLKTQAFDSYPEIGHPVLDDSDWLDLSSDFRSAISHVAPFISTDESRIFLNGVFVLGSEVVATDGRRLARVQLENGFMDADAPGIIIPRDLISYYMSMDFDTVYVADGKIWFMGPDGYLGGSLIDGQYPDYNRIIDSTDTLLAELTLTREMVSGSDVVSVFDDSSIYKKRVKISSVDGELQIHSENDKDSILFRSALETEEGVYDGPDFSMFMNYDFFMSALQEEQMEMKVYEVGGKKIHVTAGPFLAVVMGMTDDSV